MTGSQEVKSISRIPFNYATVRQIGKTELINLKMLEKLWEMQMIEVEETVDYRKFVPEEEAVP